MANEYTLGGPPPQSRSEKILMNKESGPAQSRIEELLKNYSGRGITPEQIQEALVEYFSKHPVNVPTKVSQLTNDSGYQTAPFEIPISDDGQGNYTTTSTAHEIYNNAENCEFVVGGNKYRPTFFEKTDEHEVMITFSLTSVDNGAQASVAVAVKANTLSGTVQIAVINSTNPVLPPVTATDNGKSLVVENGVWGKGYQAARTPRVAMTSSDTTPELDPNKLYVFPEMASLAITLAAITDSTIVNEYHFIFESGVTATTLTLPAAIHQPDGFTVEANHVYEVSILEGNMTAQGWAVTV